MKQTIKKSELLRQLGAIIAISNLCSPNSWRAVPNQYELKCVNGYAFQSYESLVAVKMGGRLYLGEDHDYSKTTNKYMKAWMGRTAQERREGIESGKFIYIEND